MILNRFWITLIVFIAINSIRAQNWQSLGGGIHVNDPRIMYSDSLDNYLYVAGSFYNIDGVNCKGIARWNGFTWDSLGAGIDALDTFNLAPYNSIAMTRYNSDLYLGGFFRSAGNTWAHRLAKWDGASWSAHPDPPFSATQSGGVAFLDVIDDELYMTGNFDSVGVQSCTGLAKWNGFTWQCFTPPLMDGYAIGPVCEYNGELYIAGNFQGVNPPPNDTLQDIARWDGFNWKSVGGGLNGVASGISAMCVYAGELYIAGYILGNAGNFIQKWNGSVWTDVGGGTDDYIMGMQSHNGKLYAVGIFNQAGGINASRVAVWDGSDWCGLGSAFDNHSVGTLTFYKDTLYVGGSFLAIDSDSIWKVAKWNGGNYTDQCGNSTGIADSYLGFNINIFPNPASSQIIISAPEILINTRYSILNMLGEQLSCGLIHDNNQIIDISHLQNGIYVIEINSANKKGITKLMKLN